MVVRFLFVCSLSTGHSIYSVLARGQPWRIFRFGLTNLSSFGAGVRHSWQSFGFAGGIVPALPCVPLGSATLSG